MEIPDPTRYFIPTFLPNPPPQDADGECVNQLWMRIRGVNHANGEIAATAMEKPARSLLDKSAQ